ncbi:reverse transcriptase (RNA-dependent DNA polymerase) domain-containing protein [Phthorimaea operculella]|nr:reverse transcriptase (RNA-dependent DNA polymerase) domain-containing protein [Phthorimaea operculella]
MAPHDDDTLHSLREKHPAPSRQLCFPPPPDLSIGQITFKAEDVVRALNSFHNGSSSGLDGIRPQHLKELTSVAAGESGVRLIECLTKLVNFLYSGRLNPDVCPYLYGASLCALTKKDGGIRPIAIGSTLRRLAAKVGCHHVREDMVNILLPHQLGFGTSQGCEAAIHATRAFVMAPENNDKVIIKLDVKNAFNSIERDCLLSAAKEHTPALYAFLYQVYSSDSNLYYGNDLILSQVGAQQGDPLGPLVFSLAINSIISEMKSPLNLWYLDDGTLGGDLDTISDDLGVLFPRFRSLGLEVNTAKCEFFACSATVRSCLPQLQTLVPGLRELDSGSFGLLGSPIFPEAVPDALETKNKSMSVAFDRLAFLPYTVTLDLQDDTESRQKFPKYHIGAV